MKLNILSAIKFFILIISSIIISSQSIFSQDSTFPKNAMGIDILVSTGGIGFGTFYRHEYSTNFSAFADFSISEASDENEVDYIDYYTGGTFTPGKTSRFLLLPLFVGAQYRLFEDEIMDNFRPYLNAAVGPTMIYVFPYNNDFFSDLRFGHPKYTAGGYVGFGAYFGTERSNLLGLNIRYYLIPYRPGLQSMWNKQMKEFGGLFISVSFGSAW
ncbi:MAG: hypothetical protein HY964_05050 [Ignavibacteriales bacterium]|nr:hypothetical protein [Ignavibacteriales bacterium]